MDENCRPEFLDDVTTSDAMRLGREHAHADLDAGEQWSLRDATAFSQKYMKQASYWAAYAAVVSTVYADDT